MKTFKRTEKGVTSIRTLDGTTMEHKTYINGQLVGKYQMFVDDNDKLRLIGRMVRNGWKEVRDDGQVSAGES